MSKNATTTKTAVKTAKVETYVNSTMSVRVPVRDALYAYQMETGARSMSEALQDLLSQVGYVFDES